MTFEQVKNSQEINIYIVEADKSLSAIGYTEHSFAHVGKCVSVSEYILNGLGYDEHIVELTKIADYMHDIGNVVNRVNHAQNGAIMAFRILDKMGMEPQDVAGVVTAIGNHDESAAFPVNAIAAAVILGDKTDVRRSRVRKGAVISDDIHNRVNYAVENSQVLLDMTRREILLSLKIDTSYCSVMDYFEIFMNRMMLCCKAAEFFGLRFRLSMNGNILL